MLVISVCYLELRSGADGYDVVEASIGVAGRGKR